MILALLVQHASAGNGPWVPGQGQLQMYAGVDAQRFERVKAYGLPDGPAEVTVGGGVSSFRGVLDLTYGIASRTEVELVLPVQHAWAAHPEQDLCVAFGLGACRPTTSVGVVETRAKVLLLDEVSGAPLSVAVGGVLRFGGLTAGTRERFTNAGEGTTDFGIRLSAGRSGALGGGYYVTNLDLQGLYRVPNSRTFPNLAGDLTVPGPEVAAGLDLLVAPRQSVALGPTVGVSARPMGLDIGEMLADGVTDVDRFTSLNYAQARAGGKLVLQDPSYNSVTFSVVQAFYARNNPIDTLSFSAGVSLSNLLRSER
ncbi:MAG: hypothetical protein KC656_16190 [Myxococcales bacterium]|nr:hypothetical protein [Myxococcales bacterium]